jgi:hypothetical protein
MLAIHKIIDTDAQKNPGVNIVIATCAEPQFVLAGDPTMFSWRTTITCKYDSVIQEKFNHTKPVILYTIMPWPDLSEQERKFVSDNNAREIYHWNNGILYNGGVLYRTYLQ